MWSAWQNGAVTSQKGWVHCWSRTSMARRVAPVNSRLVGLISIRRPGANTARSRSAWSNQGSSEPGGTTVPFSSWQILPWSVSHPTRTVNRGAGFLASAWTALRADGHLHQGVGPALSGGAGQMVPGSRIPTEDLFGLGPVGLEQLVFQPLELFGHDGAVNGIEVDGPEPGPAEALDQVDVPPGPAPLGVLVAPVGIGQLLPVGGGPGEVGKGQLPGLVDQQRPRPGPGPLRSPGTGGRSSRPRGPR